jgi:hypothetical protein
MAMSGDVLGELIKGNIDALTDDQKKDRDLLFKAMGAAIVSHIETAAQISGIIVTVVSVAGVTVGAGVSGPGTGTGTAPPGSIS